jgi:hypothetical protein
MPPMQATGAAIAFALAAATQAAVAFLFSQRVYAISYEIGRLARVILAGTLSGLLGVWLWPDLPAGAGLLLRPILTAATFLSILAVTGFFRQSERRFLAEIRVRMFGQRLQ